jgi:CDP-4-dehydro-6-deoxyglucose reductase
MEVSLRLPPSTSFAYLPGQYIRLTNKNHVTRSYSLAQPPVPNHPLRLHVCRVEQGAFSQYLFEEAKVGDLLRLEGPAGRFFLRDKITVDKTIFLATGTGIAPIYAMLSALTQEQRQRCGKLSLYWGNRNTRDAYLLPELRELATTLDMQCAFLFSRDPERHMQTPRYVQECMALHHADLHDAQIFASGNTAMIEAARQLAQAAGLTPECFYCDPFTAS